MPRLVFVDENFTGQSYELVIEKTTVGRSNQNTLVIHDDSVSSKHCEILVNGAEVIVRDLDSRNGTFVEGIRLNKQSQVKSGQVIRFGSVAAKLELDPAPTADKDTEMTAVYALSEIKREQRREQKKPRPPAEKTLEPLFPSPAAEQTIIMPNPLRLRSGAPLPPAAEQPPAKTSRSRLAWIVGAVIASLILLVWLVWGRG